MSTELPMPTNQPSDQPTIRIATIDDAPALAEFNRNIARETENLSLIPAVVLSGVKAVFETPARGFYVVAEAQAEARAKSHKSLVASLMVTTEWSDWRDGEFWWIQSVYVARPWRRRGLYRLLYNHVKRLAEQDRNVCGFRLYVERENRVAQQTYATLGMVETHYKVFEELVSGRDFFRPAD